MSQTISPGPDGVWIERVKPLAPIQTPGISASIQVSGAAYRRLIPPHYRGNAWIREQVDLNLILVDQGTLVVPTSEQTSFLRFYQELRKSNPGLFHRVLAPSGVAKAASTRYPTPIKEIAAMRLAGMALPGEGELYGWHDLEKEAGSQGLELQLFFQGNGLYFNRGSVLFDGQQLYDYPNSFLADLLEADPDPILLNRLAVQQQALKRPLLFFVCQENGRMVPWLHQFLKDETYRQGMQRLAADFTTRRVRAALAASPPLVIPGRDQEPVYLPLVELLSRYHANDVRHSLYCPHAGAVLLSTELSRAHCLFPEQLAASITGDPASRLRLALDETLHFMPAEGLPAILDEKGYAGRFALTHEPGHVDRPILSINPLEGVYSHLVPFLTGQGRFGVIQTSGTRGNITGNDGPTLRQLSAILRDLNRQPLFAGDPIIAAASGSQGNDVPNVVGKSRSGTAGLLFSLAPEIRLDETSIARGVVTTPRVGIAVPGPR